MFINDEGNLVVLYSFGLTKAAAQSNGLINRNIAILDTGDLSLINSYNYADDSRFLFIKQLENGNYIGAGHIERSVTTNIHKEYNYMGFQLNNDFSSIKTITNPDTTGYNNHFRFFDILPDGRIEFWGQWSYGGDFLGYGPIYEDQIVRLVVSEDDFVDTGIKIKTSIKDFFLPTAFDSKTHPNPTEATSTITLDWQAAGNLKITLNDLLGRELFELHNAFEDTGTFTKTFSIEALPLGVYYLKIIHNGNIKIEKVIRN